jgi:predicted TIM-barrel fold metal-dependent hydrolase
MSSLPRIISVDDHVVEPPDLWTSRLPSRFVQRGPRLVRERGLPIVSAMASWQPADDGEWADVWYYDDLVTPVSRMSAAVGMGELGWGTVIYDEMHPGSLHQHERLQDMDANHVDASLCFPNTLPRFCGQTFSERNDKELALLCVQAYNDWIIDDWCAGEGYGRLLPITMVPLWDVGLAVAELRRCADKGAHAVTFPENPYSLGLPSVYSGEWDPFFRECTETETVLCLHIGSSSKMPRTQPEAPFIVTSTLQFQNSMHSVLDFAFSGTLAKHPDLRIAYAEGQIGWLPFVIERADRLWAERSENSFGTNGVVLDEPPSAYVGRQVFGCIFDDEAGLAVRDRVGMSNICFEVDYPHADSTFPHSEKVLAALCTAAELDDDEIYKLVRGNAIELFGLERFGIER